MGTLQGCLILLLLFGLVPSGTTRHHSDTGSTSRSSRRMSRLWRDSISVSLSRDGLRQLRIAYRGVLALETSQLPPPVTSNSTSTQNDTQHVPPVTRLLQVTDGRRVVQTVVQGMAMTDCRTSRDPEDVLSVLDQYLRNHPRDSILGDVFAAYDSGDLSALFNITGVDFSSALSNAASRHQNGRSRHHHRHHRQSRRFLHRGVSMRLRGLHSLGRFARYLNVRQQTRECVKFYSLARQRLHIAGAVNASSSEERRQNVVVDPVVRPQGSNSKPTQRRQKRDLLSGWLIFPGTKWCGDGDIAEHGNDLGYDEALDACCREHDKCRHVIPRVSWKYSLFNYRLHTISHCRCDRRFRKCLKASSSPSAHMVGKIYFNVIGPQCFKFTRSKTCKRRNWWGKCKKYGFTKVAHPKTQKYF